MNASFQRRKVACWNFYGIFGIQVLEKDWKPIGEFMLNVHIDNTFNPIQDGGWGAKNAPCTSFPLVTSTNTGISPENFLNFSFNPFATLVQNFKFIPSVSPKLLNLNQDHPSKKVVFLVKSLYN